MRIQITSISSLSISASTASLKLACWVAAKHTHELSHLLQMPEGVLAHIIRKIAHEVHIEQVLEAPPAHCTNMLVGQSRTDELDTFTI